MPNELTVQEAKTIWGKVVLFLKEKKHIALQIACGDIVDAKVDGQKFVISTDERYLEKILLEPANKQILQDALKWQGLDCEIVVQRKLKISDLQQKDFEKLKNLGISFRVEKGDKK